MEQIRAPKQCYDNGLDHMTHNSNLVFPSAHMDALPRTPTPWGASIMKYTTPLLCIGLSESDSKLYTNFEFVKDDIINI